MALIADRRYEPTVTPLKARIIAKHLRLNDDLDPDLPGKIYEKLGKHEDTESLSDVIAIYTVAYIIPETSLSVDDVLSYDSWEELIVNIYKEYISIPELELFNNVDVQGNPHRYEVVTSDANMSTPSMGESEDVFGAPSYETIDVGIESFYTQNDLGYEQNSLTHTARSLQHNVIGAVFDELPDIEDALDNQGETLFDLFDQVEESGYIPDTVLVGERTELPPDQIQFIDGRIDTFERTPNLGLGEVIVCDKKRFGYELQVSDLNGKSYENHDLLQGYGYYPVSVKTRMRKAWVGVQNGAITRGLLNESEWRYNE